MVNTEPITITPTPLEIDELARRYHELRDLVFEMLDLDDVGDDFRKDCQDLVWVILEYERLGVAITARTLEDAAATTLKAVGGARDG